MIPALMFILHLFLFMEKKFHWANAMLEPHHLNFKWVVHWTVALNKIFASFSIFTAACPSCQEIEDLDRFDIKCLGQKYSITIWNLATGNVWRDKIPLAKRFHLSQILRFVRCFKICRQLLTNKLSIIA